jgi:hypothetical protein
MNETDNGRMLPKYISWFAMVLAFDAISAIPFARLRQENKAMRFATIKLVWIVVNIGLNIFFLILCPKLQHGVFGDFINRIYDPTMASGMFSSATSSQVQLFCMPWRRKY